MIVRILVSYCLSPMRELVKAWLSRTEVGRKLLEVRRQFTYVKSALLRHDGASSSLGQPFNAQKLRLRTIRAIMNSFQPDAVLETGSFLGSTTRFFSGNLIPVYSIEVKPLFYLVARILVGRLPDIQLMLGSSPDVLRRLASGRGIDRPLAYLDAHWWGDLPLQAEVTQILGRWPDTMIVVDDFQVPGDTGYGFDTYRGVPLSLNLLTLPSSATIAFPGMSSEFETGGRRGTLYIAQGAEAVTTLRELSDAGLLAIHSGGGEIH